MLTFCSRLGERNGLGDPELNCDFHRVHVPYSCSALCVHELMTMLYRFNIV